MSFNYKISIFDYYFGRVNTQIEIESDSLKSKYGVHTGEKEEVKRSLSAVEKMKIKDFLVNFPMEKLEERYYYKGVKDGIQMKFVIEIESKKKEIFVANLYQEDLGALVKLINNLFPEDVLRYKRKLIFPDVNYVNT